MRSRYVRRDYSTILWSLLTAGLIGLAIWAAIRDEQQWQAFVAEHRCHVTARTAARTTSGFGYVSGTGSNAGGYVSTTTTIPATTTWLCDDGVFYTR